MTASDGALRISNCTMQARKKLAEFLDYDHPEHGHAKVKIGFSWPGFFFQVLWLGVNRIWTWFWVWCLVIVVGAVMIAVAKSGGADEQSSRLLINVAALMNWALHLACGIWGNRWKGDALLGRGYVQPPHSEQSEEAGQTITKVPDVQSHTAVQVRMMAPERVPCPFCAEDIKPKAKICRYCQRDLPAEWSRQEPAAANAVGGDVRPPSLATPQDRVGGAADLGTSGIDMGASVHPSAPAMGMNLAGEMIEPPSVVKCVLCGDLTDSSRECVSADGVGIACYAHDEKSRAKWECCFCSQRIEFLSEREFVLIHVGDRLYESAVHGRCYEEYCLACHRAEFRRKLLERFSS